MIISNLVARVKLGNVLRRCDMVLLLGIVVTELNAWFADLDSCSVMS